ncbi:MAG: PQQ-binding-like beta-propeller repeat protein [Chloroflexota bacterium]
MPDPTPKTLDCPTCGAPLDYDGSRAVVRCKFCQNVVVIDALKPEKPGETGLPKPAGVPDEIVQLIRAGNKLEAIKRYRELYDVSLARAKYAVEQIEAGNLLEPEAGFQVQEAAKVAVKVSGAAAAATATGAWIGCAITSIVLLLVGGIIGFVMLQPGGPFVPRMVAVNPALTLPAAQGAPPDVVAMFYNVSDETRVIGRVNRADGSLAWTTGDLPGEGYVDEMASDGERVYAAVEANLLAFDAGDGSPAWTAILPDKPDSGEDNLILAGGLVIVMTMDRSVQAYAADTGQLAWSRPLLSYARGLRVMDGRLVLLDYVPDGYDLNVFLLDPASGREERVIFPVCKSSDLWEENLDNDSGLVYDEAANALYLAFGSSFGCIQRYDLGSGQLAWESRSDEAFNISFYGFNHVQTPSTLYFGDQGRLFALDKQTGKLDLLTEDDSYDLAPLALDGETLVLRARRTKGSERFELWGLDPGSGERTWQLVPEDAGPVDPPNEMSGLIDSDESGWTWKLTPAGLLLIEFQAEPNQLVLKTFDPASGSSLGETAIPMKEVSGDFYSIPTVIGWHGTEIYFILDTRIYALDVATGQLVMKYQ